MLTIVGFVTPNVMVVVFFAEHGVDLARYLTTDTGLDSPVEGVYSE